MQAKTRWLLFLYPKFHLRRRKKAPRRSYDELEV